ncbi:hypothetical protein M8J77_024054 [Diaphorina citri]|nr:hypothetical protein M8J77_024054 [Diaphorina citri]
MKKSKVKKKSTDYHLICAQRARQTEDNLRVTLLDELLDMQKLQTFAIDSVRLERMFTNGMVYTQQDCKPLSIEQQRQVEFILRGNDGEEL